MKKLLVILFISLILISCGKKSFPVPPEVTAPSPVIDLTAKGQVDGIVLSWKSPLTNARGDELYNLRGFVISKQRNISSRKTNLKKLIEIPVIKEGDQDYILRELEQKVFTFKDSDVTPGEQYFYVVRPVNESGVQGRALRTLSVTFIGESSSIDFF